MKEVNDLLSPDLLNWLIMTLLQFKKSGDHGEIKFIMEYGRVGKVGHAVTDKYPFKDKDVRPKKCNPPGNLD